MKHTVPLSPSGRRITAVVHAHRRAALLATFTPCTTGT